MVQPFAFITAAACFTLFHETQVIFPPRLE